MHLERDSVGIGDQTTSSGSPGCRAADDSDCVVSACDEEANGLVGVGVTVSQHRDRKRFRGRVVTGP